MIIYEQNPPIFNRVTALVLIGSSISGLFSVTFLGKFTDMFHIKDYILRLETVTLTFLVPELSALNTSKKIVYDL